jgi:multicomponent Na+:H+ antiporter subunit E
MPLPIPRIQPLHFAVRAAAAAAAWLVLVEGRDDAWLLGVPVVLAAAWVSLALRPPAPGPLRLVASLRAFGWFLRRSLVAGADVAGRALRPRLALAPGYFAFRTRLRHPAARVLLADSLSLLPGTLCARLEGDAIELHVLDREGDVEADVRAMEARIAAAFGDLPETR